MSKRDIATPSLGALSFMLRHPETWPPGFEWDWQECPQCAMGLATKVWGWASYPDCGNIARRFGIDVDDAFNLFTTRIGNNRIPSPSDVADLIDDYLRTHP